MLSVFRLPVFHAAVLCVTAWLCSVPVHAQTQTQAQTLPAGVEQAATVEGLTEYRLSNGLKVLLFPDASKPTVTVNMTYLVGSRHENYGETGMAHLLEHLLFKGSTNYPNITQGFSQRGKRPNGTTGLDRTNYFESFQASDDNLQWALSMEADRMVNSFIAQKDLTSEMTVVRNEYERGENSPFGVLYKRLQSVAFDWHSYGKSTIGNRSDIENVKIENLQAFYRTYYQPDNAVLLVSGKFDPVQTLGWINNAFGKIPKPTRTLPKQWTTEPTQDGERSFMVRRKGDTQLVVVAYKIPAVVQLDNTAAQFVGSILTNAPNGRLYKALVETGKATQVFAFPLGGVAPGLALIGASVKKGDLLEPVRDALTQAMENFDKNPPTMEEMERVRRDNANSQERFLNDPERIGTGMSEYIALGDWRFFFHDRDRTATVTAEQVALSAKTYFRRDNRTTGMFVPEDEPQRADIAAAASIEDVMKDFKPRQDTTLAEAFDPSPTNIDKRTTRTQVGGLAVALLPKKNKGEAVNVAIRLRWGDEKSLFGKSWAATMTSSLLTAGTTRYTRAQLADEMSRLKMAGGLFGFQTTRANLGAALALVGHVMREPVFPESELIQLRKQLLAGLESSRNEPGTLAGMAMALHFNRYPAGDLRAAESVEESIKGINAVSLADVKGFYQKFYGASKGEVAIVGDFDPQLVTGHIEKAFAGWVSPTPYTRMTPIYSDIAPLRKTINTPDKENGVYTARLDVSLNEESADYPALLLANYLLGGGAGLDSRLMQRVRQKEGLSYGVYSQLSINAIDRDGLFSIGATAAPQNMAKVDEAIRAELQRAVKEGFSAAEVAGAQSGIAQQRLQGRTRDGNVAGGWLQNLYLNKTFKRSEELDQKIAQLTAAEVNAAFAKYIQPDKLSVVMAFDAAKVGAPATTLKAP